MNATDLLLRLLAVVEMDNRRERKILEAIATGIDWQGLVRAAYQERIAPLAYRHLCDLGVVGDLPPELLEELKVSYYDTSVRNILIMEEAGRVTDELARAGIKTILLKGIEYAASYYKNIALRPINDIDILVPCKDFGSAAEKLIHLEYRPPANLSSLMADPLVYAVTFHSPDRPRYPSFMVDLHRHYLSSTWLVGHLGKRCDLNIIWRQAEEGKIEKLKSFRLSRPHDLIYSAQHAFGHAFDRLIMLTDLREVALACEGGESFTDAVSTARRWGLEKILAYALAFSASQIDPGARWADGISPRIEKRIAQGIHSHKRPYLTYLAMQDTAPEFIRTVVSGIVIAARLMKRNLAKG